jgi:F0F1-type ATP synthase membrane subunit b/b'
MTLALLLIVPAAHAASGMSLTPDPYLILIQLVPFLATMAMLNALLFKPMLSYLEERHQATVGAKEEATKLVQRAERAALEVEAKLNVARGELADVRATRRKAALADREERIAQARRDNDKRLHDAVEVISGESELASQELERLSRMIAIDAASKVLGRSLSA